MKQLSRRTLLIAILFAIIVALGVFSYLPISQAPLNSTALFPPDTTEKNATHHLCSLKSRDVQICIQLYQPVCGWFSNSVQCIRAPCAATYSNNCFACADKKVEYWTEGACDEKR